MTFFQYFNDLSTEKKYSAWPNSVQDLLRPTFPGMLRHIAKNLFNLVSNHNVRLSVPFLCIYCQRMLIIQVVDYQWHTELCLLFMLLLVIHFCYSLPLLFYIFEWWTPNFSFLLNLCPWISDNFMMLLFLKMNTFECRGKILFMASCDQRSQWC